MWRRGIEICSSITSTRWGEIRFGAAAPIPGPSHRGRWRRSRQRCPRTAPVRRVVTPGVALLVARRRQAPPKWRRTSASCGIQDRDPPAYIIPADQPDFLTATKFVNALIKTGITVERATAPFTMDGKNYPANSYVVPTAQAFRPHVLDMFEPQDHPNDIPYPGGPPTPPYDATGYTLAFTMGVQFDRVIEALPDGLPLEKLPV